MEVDISASSSSPDPSTYLKGRISAFQNVVPFWSEENGYSLEWTTSTGLHVLRIWPPEENNVLVEFHAVRSQFYRQWDIPSNDLVSHFTEVIDSLLATYELK